MAGRRKQEKRVAAGVAPGTKKALSELEPRALPLAAVKGIPMGHFEQFTVVHDSPSPIVVGSFQQVNDDQGMRLVQWGVPKTATGVLAGRYYGSPIDAKQLTMTLRFEDNSKVVLPPYDLTQKGLRPDPANRIVLVHTHVYWEPDGALDPYALVVYLDANGDLQVQPIDAGEFVIS